MRASKIRRKLNFFLDRTAEQLGGSTAWCWCEQDRQVLINEFGSGPHVQFETLKRGTVRWELPVAVPWSAARFLPFARTVRDWLACGKVPRSP